MGRYLGKFEIMPLWEGWAGLVEEAGRRGFDRDDLLVRVRVGCYNFYSVAKNVANYIRFSIPFLFVSKLSKSVYSHFVSILYPLIICT